ncbi:MAG: squalene--hopene cyclase [Armatimonadetes bacterium]|nr:squalene--hopene cyclase [Armatimonadota bacterium]
MTATKPALAPETAVQRATAWLLERRRPDGHWCGELEGDTILETEYVMLLHFLGNPDEELVGRLVDTVFMHWQNPDGGIPQYPGGPSDVSCSVKAYFAGKLAGRPGDAPEMMRLRERILTLGGVTRCNTFTKLHLAVFGQYDWAGVPSIPAELALLPRWFYLNIYEMSSWSRCLIMPLALVNAARPCRTVGPGRGIDELYLGGRPTGGALLEWARPTLSWRNAFLVIDRLLKVYERIPRNPLRALALRKVVEWIHAHQVQSAGVGAIFPAMTHTVMGLICSGTPASAPTVRHELDHLRSFLLNDERGCRLQPCLSPVWDTAIAVNALLESGTPATDTAVRTANRWLLSKQTRRVGDWAVKTPQAAPGGWFFEYENERYPDLDDTAMVLMALHKAYCPNGEAWRNLPAEVSNAMERAVAWVLSMQNRDGGWASFDRNNCKRLFETVPYADHNAMLDPSTADITARVLEALALYGYTLQDRFVQRAVRFIERDQCADGSWFGRWGVNYLYGTWQALRGLEAIGYPLSSSAMRRGADWLETVQNPDGGWGETCRSYEQPELYKAKGESTPSQTAWAVMGLASAGRAGSDAAQRGLDYLCATQRPDGAWDEAAFTGTGFPRVFYLRYHYYRHYFPLLALGRLTRTEHGAP